MSCQTTPAPPTESEPAYPPIDFPEFPDPSGEARLEGDEVRMSLDYWLSVTDYVIDVRRAAGIYRALREAESEATNGNE